MLWEEDRCPRLVWLLEEEEEVDESVVTGDSWGDTQVLAGRLSRRCV